MRRFRAVSPFVMSLVGCSLVLVLSADLPLAQTTPPAAPPAAAAPTPAPKDPLGRDSPRGTVLGFLNAARKGENELASRYLHTSVSGQEAAALSRQLFVVLDARLPARLAQLSELPDGSRADPLMPNQEVVGAIASASGQVEVVLERVPNADGGQLIWLFAGKTLEMVPALYDEITRGWGSGLLGRFLNRTRFGRLRALEWLVALLAVLLFYGAISLLNRMLAPVIRRLRGRFGHRSALFSGDSLPTPIRLLLLAAAIGWFLSSVALSLFVRQFWSNTVGLIAIVAGVWLLILLNGDLERYCFSRVRNANAAGVRALLHVLRRVGDALVIFAGLIAVLRLFAVDPTPALAGLGVGGIAVALAAQKTLENVIAGASLIFDQAVRVGDSLKMGEIFGTVDHIGLRSTRIRTLDRTIVSVPNSQIANASLETISARDKYWFHPVVGLRYETTSDQIRTVVGHTRKLLEEHSAIDPASIRVRFLRLGAFSLDVDVFAYVFARDWNHFLEIQEDLLLSITGIVERSGAQIAFPSQTMYVENAQPVLPAESSAPTRG
jgi:MscS family membrane protein